MAYNKKRFQGAIPAGFFRFEEERTKACLFGFGDGGQILLRDEYGNVWNGTVETDGYQMVRYHFRNGQGRTLTGIADGFCIVLRDREGNTWRGFVD